MADHSASAEPSRPYVTVNPRTGRRFLIDPASGRACELAPVPVPPHRLPGPRRP